MSLIEKIKDWFVVNPTAQTLMPWSSPLSEEDQAKAKIRKAIEIIETNKVCENATFLINNYQVFGIASIKYTKMKGSDGAAKDLGQKECLKVDTLVRFEFEERVIELVALAMHFGEFSSRESGIFHVRFNGTKVLETSCSRDAINEAYDRGFTVYSHPHAFKAGEWMALLAYLVSESNKETARWKLAKEKKAKDELKANADRIDLG
jgi:hypothetical protein